jgi:transposase
VSKRLGSIYDHGISPHMFFGGLSACLVGMEACPSAHYWSSELQALGHTVKLMPPSYVKSSAVRMTPTMRPRSARP